MTFNVNALVLTSLAAKVRLKDLIVTYYVRSYIVCTITIL